MLKNFLKVSAISFSTLLLVSPVFAGEIGVTNFYGHSWREGSGSSTTDFTSTTVTSDQYTFEASKTDIVDVTETGPSQGSSGTDTFTSYSEASSSTSGTGTLNSTVDVTGGSDDIYTFGSNNFTHSVGVFSR